MSRNKYNPEEIIGQKFGKWTVVEFTGHDKNRSLLFKCRCECGAEQNVRHSNLIRGISTQCKSCASTKHGYRYTRLYGVWKDMRRRCYNPNSREYEWYGALGVTVCDEWKTDFASFHDWAYSTGYNENAKKGECTLDRIDSTGNYCPENCRWTTAWIQSVNQRKRKSNTSGYTGIGLRKRNINPWAAVICINRKTWQLGTYKTQKEALAVRNSFIIANNLPYKIQEYKGELFVVNKEQKLVQKEWKKSQ